MIIPMIDSLFFGVDTESYGIIMENKADYFLENKEKAKTNQLNKISEKNIVKIGDMSFEILSNGANGYAFILHNAEYEIKLAQYRSRNDDFFPIKIRIKSECLWSYGPFPAYKKIIDFINLNFGNVTKTKISRADLCCHTDILYPKELDIATFKGLFIEVNIRNSNRKISGLDFGSRSSKIFCRIYNKILEVQKGKIKTWFYQIWENADNAYNRENVWNVEFELKREFFHDYIIESVDDLFLNLKTIWDYCTRTWLVKINRDRTRTENCTIDSKWKSIQNAFNGFDDKPLIKRDAQIRAEAEALIPALTGYITTITSRLGDITENDVFPILEAESNRYLKQNNRSLEEEILKKRNLLNIKKGGKEECKN